jgi:UDP:flavonoid glycosyltransferase YjiC (YdhE family)
MRVLVTSPAAYGHIHPMIPMARALLERGNEVLWAVPTDGVALVERAGIPVAVAGASGLTDPVSIQKQYPELNELGPTEVGDVMFGKIFGATVAPSMLADLGPLAKEWKPDLVLADAGEFAAHIVAAELGIPSVTKGFGPILPERRMTNAAGDVAALWQSRGLDPRPYAGCYETLYLDVYPPEMSLEPAAHIPRRQLLRPVSDEGGRDPSESVRLPDGPPGSPLLYVTMGTVFNDPQPLRVALAALAAVGARALATVGPKADPAVVGPQPASMQVERYVPQALVLPRCDAVICHGGSGTMLASLTLGLPVLCLPQGADQFLNARALAASGAGISLLPHEATVDAVAEATARILEDPSYRESAIRVSESIASMPSPEEVAAVLEDLV